MPALNAIKRVHYVRDLQPKTACTVNGRREKKMVHVYVLDLGFGWMMEIVDVILGII